jgi:hypothetical protein
LDKSVGGCTYPHSQVGCPSFLCRKPLITAAAQPTPEETVIALVGQFMRQAPHSMQSSRLTIVLFRFITEKTP